MSYKDDFLLKLKPGDKSIHPMSMNFIENDTKNNICLTKFKINNKNITDLKYNYNCVYNLDNYNKIMYIPPIGINYTDLLTLYNIDFDNIDDLIRWVNNNNKNIFTVSRVINSWIKHNFNLIKKHTKSLVKIINILYDSTKLKNVDEDLFVKEWIKKNNNIFYLNFIDDLNYHIKKNKYNKNKKKYLE
jgi:hypothetical protein